MMGCTMRQADYHDFVVVFGRRQVNGSAYVLTHTNLFHVFRGTLDVILFILLILL
jgi:hypothetical protein